jgi:hypothetical protein
MAVDFPIPFGPSIPVTRPFLGTGSLQLVGETDDLDGIEGALVHTDTAALAELL